MEKRGVTRTGLAREFGIATSRPGTWIAGVRLPDPNTIRSLAIKLRVSTDYLLNVPGSALGRGQNLPASVLEEAVRAHVIECLHGGDAGEQERRRVERSVPSGRELLARLELIAKDAGDKWKDQRRAELRDRWIKRTQRALVQRAVARDGNAAIAMAYLAAADLRKTGGTGVLLAVPWVHYEEVCAALLGRDVASKLCRDGTPDEASFDIPLEWEQDLPEAEREAADALSGKLPKLVIRHVRPGDLGEPDDQDGSRLTTGSSAG